MTIRKLLLLPLPAAVVFTVPAVLLTEKPGRAGGQVSGVPIWNIT